MHIAKEMRAFYDSITEIGVNQNPILVCFGIENVCSFLQHIFFSGNAESVTEKVFLNTEDLKRQFGDLRAGQNLLVAKEQSQTLFTQSTSSLQKSRTLVRRAFIDKGEPTDYARKRILEHLVKKAFPSIFWEEDQGDFFVFPVHQAPKSYNAIPGDKVGADCTEKEHSSKQIKSDSITCHFRKFIYSYFVRVDELTEKAAESAQRLLLVSKNIVSHANHHSSSEANEEIHADILTTTLQECYVRDHAEANIILRKIFGEGSFDSIFGSTKIGSQLLVEPGASHSLVIQESGDTITSLCFQHSEQALLNSIFVNKIPFKEFLIEYLFEKMILGQLAELKIGIIGTSSEDTFETTALESLASVNDDTIDDATTSTPKPLETDAEKLNVIDISGVEEKPIIAKSLVFTLSHPINLEIISPRHICKFCRGSLHLRCQQVQQILEEGIVVEPIKDKMLTSPYRDFPKIIPKESQDLIMGQDEMGELNKKPSLETHRRLYELCKVHRAENRAFSEFMSRYQRYCLYNFLSKEYSGAFLGDGKLNIRFRNVELVVFATSFRQTEDYLMGILPLIKK